MDNNSLFNRDQLDYRQSTSALIIKDNQVLIIQKKSFKDNEWDMPGGGVDQNETPAQAIIRELSEELGCPKFKILKQSSIIDCYEWPDEVVVSTFHKKGIWRRGQQRTQFFVEFLGQVSEIQTQIEEIKALKWIDLNQIESYFVFPNQYQKFQTLLLDLEIS